MKIGLVLSGGLARGAAQLGFIEGFFKYFSYGDISIISSSSIGSVNAIAVSFGNVEGLKNIYLSRDIKNAKMLKNMFKDNLIGNTINQIACDKKELKIPCYISAACMNKLVECYYYYDSKSTIEEIKEMIEITTKNFFVNGFLKKYNKNLYTDGGTFDNVPTYPLFYNDCDFCLILHSTPNYYPPYKLYEKMTILDIDVTKRCKKKVNSFSYQKENLTELYHSAYNYGLEIGERLSKCENNESLRLECQKIVKEEIMHKSSMKNIFTLVKVINKLFESRSGYL